jgi:hypothetical protein
VHLEGEHAYLWMDTIFASRISAPRGELGAAFDVVATLDCGKSTSLINQRFYPYAEGGAVAYVPNGQRACGGPVDTGWSIVDPYVMSAVTEAGLPEPKAPAPARDPIPPAEDAAAGSGSKAVGDTEPIPAPAAPAAETTSFPRLPVIVGLAALLAMLTGAAVVHRRRRSIVA